MSPRKKQAQETPSAEKGNGNAAPTVVADGKLVDYITGKAIKDTAKEQVRQKISRAIIHEYGIAPEDIHPDYPILVGGRKKKVSLAIFSPDSEHTVENVRRLVVVAAAPKLGKKVTRMRTHQQADAELNELKNFMAECTGCDYGLWTNSLDFFYLRKEESRFEPQFYPVGDWPAWGESVGTRQVASHAHLRSAEPEMLLIAFRRCHNFIHGNEGMPKDAAFWQFLYLIFAKMHDEKKAVADSGYQRRFWVGPTQAFDPEGQQDVQRRISALFQEAKEEYKDTFQGNEEITLSRRALAFIASELSRYDFTRTDIDAKGVAYQEIVRDNIRGDRGQYFTPRKAIALMIKMLDPKPDQKFLDPACGTGGFLVEAIAHQGRREKARRQAANKDPEATAEFIDIQKFLGDYTKKRVHGCDFDPFLVRASRMNLVMASNDLGNVFHLNSLEFPEGHLAGLGNAKKAIKFASVDVIATNPPFGSSIPVTDKNILQHYDLAHNWERTGNNEFRNTGAIKSAVAPEILFIERCLDWLKPGGHLGIVLPDGILGNPGDEYIRWWVMRHAYVLASVDLPVETFIVEANVNILTSLLFLKKKTADEIKAEDLRRKPEEYPVFMAVAEKVGYDRRGNTLYKRNPDGEEIWQMQETVEKIRIGGVMRPRTLSRRRRILDDDLPVIAQKYEEFRAKYPEPGS